MLIKCKRCGIETDYSPNHARTIKSRQNCVECRAIDDQFLEEFKAGKYCRCCPNCQSVITHKSKRTLLQAKNINSPCKSCTNKKLWTDEAYRNNQLQYKRNMPNITRQKLSSAMKKRWENTEDKSQILEQLKRATEIFQENLKNPEYKQNWALNQKKAFEKYKGDNHWMKRPEVMEKIINSCKKYKGNNHWFKTEKGHYKIVNGVKIYKNDQTT